METLSFTELVKLAWPIFIVIIGVVIWAIRNEGRLTSAIDKIKQLETDLNALGTKTDNFREDIKVAVGKIETSLVFVTKEVSETKELIRVVSEKIDH